MQTNKLMENTTSEMLKRYGLSDKDLGDVRTQMLFSFLLLIQAADGFENKNDTMLYNSCGEIKAPDGTHYQVQVSIVPDKKHWVNSEGVYYSTPMNENIN